MASKQTLRNERYQKKAGWVSKSYKLKKEVVDAYAEACEKAGVTSVADSSRSMMKEFIEKVNNE